MRSNKCWLSRIRYKAALHKIERLYNLVAQTMEVLDLAGRKVEGWALGERMERKRPVQRL